MGEFHLKGDVAGLAFVGINETAGSIGRTWGCRILGRWIPALHDEGNRLPHHPMKHRAVIHTAFDEVGEIASSQWSRIAVELQSDRTAVGVDADQSLATEAWG